jgi:hypothetical protein
VSVTGSTVHNLHFEAFYCGRNSEHAEIELVSNTVFGDLWWETTEERDEFETSVHFHNMTRSRPGRVRESNNTVLPRLPTTQQEMMRVAQERKAVDVNDESFAWFCEQVDRETEKLLAAAEEGYIF